MNSTTALRATALSPEMAARLREHLPEDDVLQGVISIGTTEAVEEWLQYHFEMHRLAEDEIIHLLDTREISQLRQMLGECVWVKEMLKSLEAERTTKTHDRRKRELENMTVSVEDNRRRLRPTVFCLSAYVDEPVRERIVDHLEAAGFHEDLFSWSSVRITCADNRRFSENELMQIRRAIQKGSLETAETLLATESRHLSVV